MIYNRKLVPITIETRFTNIATWQTIITPEWFYPSRLKATLNNIKEQQQQKVAIIYDK